MVPHSHLRRRTILEPIVKAALTAAGVGLLLIGPVLAKSGDRPANLQIKDAADLIIEGLVVTQGPKLPDKKAIPGVGLSYVRKVTATFAVKNIGRSHTATSLTAKGAAMGHRGGFTVNAIYKYTAVEVKAPPLAPGESRRFSVSAMVPVGDRHSYQIVADWYQEIREQNELNNEGFAWLTTKP